MWYWLNKFESIVFTLPIVIYHAAKGIRIFTKCQKCGRRLFDPISFPAGFCEDCLRQLTLSDPVGIHSRVYHGAATKVSPSPQVDLVFKRARKLGVKGRILDVGCGPGRLLARFQQALQWCELYGMDMAPGALQAAAKQVNGGFFRADARSMPLHDGSFDYVFCTEVLEHTVGNAAVKECHRVLRPGGIAVFTVPNGSGPHGKYNPHHVRSFTFKSFVNLLKSEGFQVIYGGKLGLRIFFVSRLMEMLSTLLGRRLPTSDMWDVEVPELFAVSFLIVCRRPLADA